MPVLPCADADELFPVALFNEPRTGLPVSAHNDPAVRDCLSRDRREILFLWSTFLLLDCREFIAAFFRSCFQVLFKETADRVEPVHPRSSFKKMCLLRKHN